MKKIIKASKAIAETVALCKPKVVSVYPITPQTLICQELAGMIVEGKIKAECLEVESEFSALSCLSGAAATGVRTFTTTCSQGLALMHEVLFAVAGLRLPIVMVVTNRALSAPINIWCDEQDSITERDSGWIQFYAETVQEAVDTLIQAYKIAELQSLPVMVNVDGHYLTHVVEPVDIPSQKQVDKFLPAYKPEKIYLNPEKPLTQGGFAYPAPYMMLRKQLNDAVSSSLNIIKKINEEFANHFKRSYGDGLVEQYKDAEKMIVALGSVCGTVKEVVDKRKDIGLLRIRCFRPFPRKEVIKALKDKECVIIIDRNISIGNVGTLFTETRDALFDLEKKPKIRGIIAGLGGKDISAKQINEVFKNSERKKDEEIEWLT